MNKIFSIFLALLMALSVKGEGANEKYLVPDIPIMNEWIDVNFVHIDFDAREFKIGDLIKRGDLMGHISKYPDTLSLMFDKELKQSMAFYNQQDFGKASDILKEVLTVETNNLFILNAYARACYWNDREESFRVYKLLVNKLDSTYQTPDNKVVVDLWFREAYWKLGTLYMDHRQFDKAYIEISRSLASIQDMKNTNAYSQGLQYLTECAYEMYQDELARYLAKRTLIYDSKNEYAREVIKNTKKL